LLSSRASIPVRSGSGELDLARGRFCFDGLHMPLGSSEELVVHAEPVHVVASPSLPQLVWVAGSTPLA
jgi:hypothetical protein